MQWIPAFDPNRIISGYEVTWNVLEDDKGEHVINSPIRSSGVIPADATTYTIRDLSTSRITVLILSIITIIELIENKSIGETCGNYSFRTWNDLKFELEYRSLQVFIIFPILFSTIHPLQDLSHTTMARRNTRRYPRNTEQDFGR